MRADGYLARSSDGLLVIRYRSGTSPERVRFTIAHEIAHIILAQVQGKDLSDPAFRREGGSTQEEVAVNRIAAELLMPDPLFRKCVQSKHPSWPEIWRLRSIFAVSTTAILRRILELPGLPAVFLRIDCPCGTDALHYQCETSQDPRVFFHRPIEKKVQQILAEAEKGIPSKMQIYFGDTTSAIQMASHFVPFYGKPQCWSVGWQAAE